MLRQALVAVTPPDEHGHAGAIGGRVKAEIECQNPPAEGIEQERQPRPAQQATGPGTDQFEIELRVVTMRKLPGKVPVPGGVVGQPPDLWAGLIGRALALPAFELFHTRPPFHMLGEGRITRRWYVLRLARQYIRSVHRQD